MDTLPSPAYSPPLEPVDAQSSQPSRKRQRSQSMQSHNSSSSMKRPISEDANHDMDTYMADQGGDDIGTLTLTPSTTPSYASVPPADKLPLIDDLKRKNMVLGETWYLVSSEWWKRWRKACTGEVDKRGPISEADLGPVNNSSLLDEYSHLRSPIVEGMDVEYVPEEAWNLLVTWYGIPTIPLPRQAIARGQHQLVQLELRPPRFRVLRLTDKEVLPTLDVPSHPYVTLSTNDTLKTLCECLAKAVTPSPDSQITTPYRVWKVQPSGDDFNHPEFPLSELYLGETKIVDDAPKTLEEAGMESEDAFVVEFKESDHWLVDETKISPIAGLATAQEHQSTQPLFGPGGGFFDRMSPSGATQNSTAVVPKTNGFGSFGPSFGLSNGSKAKTLEPGTLGLGNMGNTCFMNSALQCLAHTKELTDYFLTGVYQDELNPDNPLGMQGAIAEAFGALLERIWATSGPSTSYSPREFKTQLQRFAPQFHGYQQHDSQELVAFLLDGLHEDLNRVKKKPYVEKPDWEGGGDLEMVQLAQKSWEGYMMRNDSVIVDLFQGQYQSTLVCPECEKVSITFDPFMYLTLPLPVHKKWRHTVYYIPWDLQKPHVKVPVEIGRDASFRDLRHLLGRWMQAEPDNLLTLEIFNHRFYKNLDDSLLCGEMADGDTIVCYELPCHSQQSRTYKKQPGDPIIVPVFLCDLNAPGRQNAYMTSNRTPSLFGYPTVVVIDPEQATSLNAIYDAVIARLQRWTAHARDLFVWEAPGGRGGDEQPIQINGDGVPMLDSIAEITENGDVITLQEPAEEEGDIVDEKSLVISAQEEMDEDEPPLLSAAPIRVGTKKDLFELKVQTNHKEYGTSQGLYAPQAKFEPWEKRTLDAEANPVLLREGDAFYCELDENMKAYYFGESRRFEHALWDQWEEFLHPEYEESRKAASEKKNKGITLQDCLDEFTKEEKLGEDDLWYCPRCKKHQQATKKFDLWKVPDVLVVHLKRFSNSRTLRDKIDTLVDFPVEGLDLGGMVGERTVAQRLVDQGVAVEELKLESLEQPLVYDLFAVDEHMGGLGGGHYRAYAYNPPTDKWYHFDDSYVTPAHATDSVTSSAYLLFYRRRTDRPLGGITHQKIEEARLKSISKDDPPAFRDQLPTPPLESSFIGNGASMSTSLDSHDPISWAVNGPKSGSGSPSANNPPSFEPISVDDTSSSLSNLGSPRLGYSFPEPSAEDSPSSVGAEVDPDTDAELEDEDWTNGQFKRHSSPNDSWSGSGVSGLGSPSDSASDSNPFGDAYAQQDDDIPGLLSDHDQTV